MTQRPHVEGVRVLRGRDWEEGEADGGEGHLGTVQASPGNGVVHVLWDIGQESTCRAGQGGKFDLRVFDTATVGVLHDNTICLACGEQDIYGVLWRCKDCPGCDLCSVCYANDKHDLRHQFLRIVFPGDPGKLMKKRKVSVRIRAMGLFPGAKVTRGKDWEWKNQDGGPGSEGELLEILNQATKRGKRTLAKVRWPSGKSNIYRLAYEGHVDITCTDEEAGGFYYRDHLPCLDTADFTTLRTSETPTEKTNVGGGVSSSPDPKDDVPQQTTSPADEVPQQATPPVDEVLQQATPTPDDVPQPTTPPADALLRLTAPPTTEVQAEDSKDQDSSHSKSSWPDKDGEDSSDPPALSSDNGEGKPTTVTAASLDLSSEGSVESPTRLPLTPHSEVCLHGQKTDPGTSEDSDQRLRPESKTQDQRSEPGALEDPAVQKLLVEPEEEPKESTDSSEVDSLHAAQARSDSKPEDGRADGADVEDDPRKITTGSAAPSPAGELPPSPTTALSSSTPGTGDCLQTTPASTPEATQDSGFEEHGGAGDSRSTDTTEASLDEQTTLPQDVTVWPASGPAAGRETDRQATASDTATAEKDSSTESQDSPAFLDPRAANEVSGGGACLHDSSAVALTTAVTTETGEKQPTGSSDSAVTQDSTSRPETQASTRSPMGTATGQDGNDMATNRLSGLDKEAATGTDLQTETQKVEATTPEEDGLEHKTSQSAVAAQAGDGQHRDAGDGQLRDAGDGQHLDSGDGQLRDAGDGQHLDSGDGQLPDAGDGQLPDAGDGQLPDAGDGQLPDAGDGQLPDAGDGQLSDAGDGQLGDAGDGQLRDAGDGLPLDPTGATLSAESQEREADAASERPPDPTGPATVEEELGAAAAAAAAPEQRDAVPTDGAHGPENIQETSSFQEGEIISSVAEADRKPEDGFRVGDRAAIGVPPDTLVELQQNFGGVTHSMLKKIGQVGVVTRVRPPGTVGLRLGKVVFRMNPVALLKVHQHSTGDKVLIRDDLYQLRVLNDRLGWNSGMDLTAGKIGEVTKVDSDGDLTVSFGHRSYIYSPSCCLPAPPGSSVEELSHRGARAVGNNGTESLLGHSSMKERLAGLMSGATGGRGHRIRLGDLAQLGSLGDLAQLGSLGDLAQLSSLGEHLSQLQQLMGMGGLGVVTGDESTEEGRLHMAIIAGDVDKVKEMCRANTALVSSVHNGLTPLMLASHQGKRKVALALLDLGADVNGMGVKQQTALGAALEEKEEEMAMLLLEKGADPRHKNGKERTPLHMAVFNRLNEVAQIIIHMGADINAQDKYGDTPLHDAIARQNTVMVDLLLQLDNINVRLVNRKGYTPLQLACRVQNTEVVGLLLALDNTNVNQLKEQDFAALHICVRHKYLDGVRLLITNGNADVNLPSGRLGLTALHMACLHAHVDIVESLLELGAKVNIHDHNGETPLHVAMGGYDGKEKSSEERERAVQARIRAACLLITNGAFVDAENKAGRPPTTYGPSEVQIGVAQFIDQNPLLVRRKGQSGGATSDGAKQSLIMTSLRKVSLPCRQCQKESDVTLTPCGHRVVCATCALTVKFCPLCGTEVTRGQGEKDHTLAAKRPATAEGSQASDPRLSQPGSISNPPPSLPGSTSDPDVSRPGSRLDSTVDTQASAKRNGQSVEPTSAAESISEVTVTAGRSPDAVDQVQGLTSDAQLEKPSADPSEDQPVTSSTDLSPKQPVTVSTDLSPNLPENPSEELSQEQAENPSAELSQEQAENPSSELSQEQAENPSAELSQEQADNPSAELSQELAENPSAELSQEQADNPSAELSQEQAENPSAELSQEQAENPSAELSQEQAENPSAELSQEQAENPSSELSQEQAENPSAELSQEQADNPSAELSQEQAENPSAELSQEQAENPSAELSQEQAENPSAELSQEQAENPSAELSQEQAENPSAELSHEQADNPSAELSQEQAENPSAELSQEQAENPSAELSQEQADNPSAELSQEQAEVLTDVGLLSSFVSDHHAAEPTAQVDTPQPGESPDSLSLQPEDPLPTTPTLSKLHQDANSEGLTQEENALKIAVSPQAPAEESESHAAGKESHHGGDSPNRTVSGQAPPPGSTTAGEPAHLPWSITAGEQAHPSMNATAAQQATPLSADGHNTPPRNVTLSEQAPPPLSVTASGQAPPPFNVTGSGQAPPPLNVTASGQAPPPLSVTASGQAPPPLNVTASGHAPPPLNVTASRQARPPWDITVGAQARPPHNVTASGQARPPWNTESVADRGGLPWNTESVADRGGLPWADSPKPVRDELGDSLKPDGVNHTTSGCKPKVFDRDDDDFVLPDLPSVPAGGGWVVMGPGGPFDLTGSSALPGGVASHEKPRVDPWSFSDQQVSGRVLAAIGEGRGNVSQVGVGAEARGRAPQASARTKGRGNTSRANVWEEGTGSALRGSVWEKGQGNMSEFSHRGGWEETASSQICLGAEGGETGTASRAGSREDRRWDMAQLSMREDRRRDVPQLSMREDRRRDVPQLSMREDQRRDVPQLSMREDRRRDMAQLSMREDRRRDVPQLSMREGGRWDMAQLSMREGGRWDAPHVSARHQRGSNTPVVKIKAEERKDTSALSAVDRDPKELSDLNSQGLQAGLHFEKKSAMKEEKKEVARPPSPSDKASPDDSSSPGAEAQRQVQSPVPKEGAASTVSSDSAPSTSSASDKCGEGNKPETPLTSDAAAPVARTEATEPTGGGLNSVVHNVTTYFQADNLTAILESVARSDGAGAWGKASPAAGVYQPANRSLNAEALLATPSSAADSRTREVDQQPKTAAGNRQPEGNREESRGASERERLQPNSEIAKSSDGQKPRSAGSPRETEPRHTNTTTTDISKSHLANDTSKTQSGIQKSDGPNPQTGISSSGTRPPKGETTVRDAVQSADDSDEVSEGDRVVIRVSEERLVELQREYGGTTKGMLQCVGRTGTVTGRKARGAICVKFSSLAYRFNPRALLKVHVHNSGDTVRVLLDLDLVKLLNKRVGYCPALAETLGKVGTITKIDDDYDITVKFGQSSFRYSPACCVPAPGATPDTVTATPGGEGEVVNHSRDEASSDRQAFMKRLAQMVKEGTTVSKVMGSSRGDSSAISRLFTAIRDGNSQLVKEMCQNDPSLISKTHEGRMLTPLMYASWKGQIGIVRELLDMGADVNESVTGGVHDSRSAVSAALESGEEETAVLLLQRGADPMRRTANQHRTPLHMAAAGNHVQVLQVLLQMDVDVNAKDVFGDTPLIDALLTDSRATVDILLGLDHVDVTVVNHKGITPLHAACLKSIPSAVEQILTRDTSHVNNLMNGEYAPLHLAANDDCVENIRLLLNSGADVNMVAGGDHEGNRPIHHACLNGHLPSVEVLLDFGSEVNVANKTGDTPLHFAMGGRIPKEVAGQASEIFFQEERVRIACTLISNGAFVDAEDSKGRTCMRYGGPEIQAAVQDFMDRNRQLVRKKGKGGSGGEARPTLVLRGVPLPCALCKSSMSDVALLPCGHKTACSKCAGALAVCPLCQCRVDSTTTDDQKGALFEAISHAW